MAMGIPFERDRKDKIESRLNNIEDRVSGINDKLNNLEFEVKNNFIETREIAEEFLFREYKKIQEQNNDIGSKKYTIEDLKNRKIAIHLKTQKDTDNIINYLSKNNIMFFGHMSHYPDLCLSINPISFVWEHSHFKDYLFHDYNIISINQISDINLNPCEKYRDWDLVIHGFTLCDEIKNYFIDNYTDVLISRISGDDDNIIGCLVINNKYFPNYAFRTKEISKLTGLTFQQILEKYCIQRKPLLQKMQELNVKLQEFSLENNGDKINYSEGYYCITLKVTDIAVVSYWSGNTAIGTVAFISYGIAELAIKKFKSELEEIQKEMFSKQ